VSRAVNEHDDKLKYLTYKVFDLETKSRNKNILIYGYEENRYDVYDIVNEFICDQLRLEASDFYIDHAERLGQVNNHCHGQATSKRTILVTFRYPSEVDKIMSSARNLAGSRYAVDRDYPTEIRLARKSMWSEYKEYRRTATTKFSYVSLQHCM